MPSLLHRFRALLSRQRFDQELDEEMRMHVERLTVQFRNEGLDENEARRRALIEFGAVESLREAARDARGLTLVEDLVRDVRHSVRVLLRAPAFAAAAVVTIALGIGVNAGIFTVLNGVLLRDLPAPDAHELVSISQRVEGVDTLARRIFRGFSTSEYNAYRDRAETLSGLLARADAPRTTLGGEAPQEVVGQFVSCSYFAVLEQAPALGRAFSEEDCQPGAAPVVVIGHQLWTVAFGADSAVLGRVIELNRQGFTVVGVASEDTYGGSPWRIGYFAPLSAEPLLRRAGSRYADDNFPWLSLIGRRSEGDGLERVRAELGVISAQIDGLEPGRSTTLTVERAGVDNETGESRTAIAALLMAPFGLVLLIACANVANLLLARGSTRSPEIGIRLALGASRARVIRQLLTESVLISLAGGLLGSAFGLWSFQYLVAFALPAVVRPGFPLAFALDFGPDVRVLSFAVVLTLLTSVLFGLLPALNASKPNLFGVIKQDSAGGGSGSGGGRLRGTLVSVQVAICMVLMIAAGLLARGLYATYTVDLGFEHRGVTVVSLEPSMESYDSGELQMVRERLKDRIEALPGVEAVAWASEAPLGDEEGDGIRIRVPTESESGFHQAIRNTVAPGYFAVLGIPLIRGRAFTETDVTTRTTGITPIIVSETTARDLLPGGDPIGRTFLARVPGSAENIALEVVGIVRDAQVSALGEANPYSVYMPGGDVALLVRSRTDSGATASAIHAAVRSLDPELVVRVIPLEANLAWWRGVSGMVTTLGAGLGALALVLASVGIYGIVGYTVSRRYREIGIRMALGAQASDVLGMILRQTMRPVVVGALVGVVAAIALSRILSSFLFGVSPADPIGLGGAVLLVMGVALIAGIVAARRGTWVNPTTTLHYE